MPLRPIRLAVRAHHGSERSSDEEPNNLELHSASSELVASQPGQPASETAQREPASSSHAHASGSQPLSGTHATEPQMGGSLTLRERRVAANAAGRERILLPGLPGAPRGPASPIPAIEARARARVSFKLAGPLPGLEEESDYAEHKAPVVRSASSSSQQGWDANNGGTYPDSQSSRPPKIDVGSEAEAGTSSPAPDASPPPAQPRRLMSFTRAFSRGDMEENSFSWSLLSSGSELLDMVSSYLPGFSSRPSTPCASSPVESPPSPRSLARTVSSEFRGRRTESDVGHSTRTEGADSAHSFSASGSGKRRRYRDGSAHVASRASSPNVPTLLLPGAPHVDDIERFAPLPAAGEFSVSSYSGSSAHAAILKGLSALHVRPVVAPLVPERERKRALARLRSSKMIQEAWRRHRHSHILTSNNQESMQKALMSEIVTQEIFASGQAAESQTPLVVKSGSALDDRHHCGVQDHSTERHPSHAPQPPPSIRRTGTPPRRTGLSRLHDSSNSPRAEDIDLTAKDLFPEAGDVDIESGKKPIDEVGDERRGACGWFCRGWCHCHSSQPRGCCDHHLRWWRKPQTEQIDAPTFTTINGMHVMTPPQPSIDEARKYASMRLARQQEGDEAPGELYPLYTPLETFDRFGTDISQYMHFVYYTSRLFFCLFFLNLSNLVINMEGGNLSFLKLNSAAAGVNPVAVMHTIGNTETTGVLAKGGHSYSVVEVVTGAILVSYLYWLRGRMSEIRSRIRNSKSLSTLTAADFTVMVSSLPETWKTDDVRKLFERFGEVVHVSLALNNRELILEMKRTTYLRDRHTEASLHLLNLMSKHAPAKAIGRARTAALQSLDTLDKHRGYMRSLMRGRYRHTGHAFVTFNKASVAREVLRKLSKGGTDELRFESILGEPVHVKRAPEPSDVLWENLQYSKYEQAVRQTASTLTMCVIAAAGIFGIFSSNFYIAPGVNPTVSISSTIQYLGQMAGSLLVNVAGHLFFFLAVLSLAKVYERQHSHGDKEKEMMIKMTVFQVLSIVMQAVLYLYIEVNANQYQLSLHQGRFGAGWYVSGAQVVIVALAGDAAVINLGVDLFRPVPDLVHRYVFARRAKTQAKMNELYAIDADVTLGFRVQLMNKIVVVGLMFSFAIPILYLLVFFFLWSAHWVDRYTFLRRLTPPPVTHDGLMEVVLNYIFPAAIILHLVMSVIFFNDICAGSKNAHSMCDKIFGDVSTGNPFSVNGSDTCSNVDALGSTSIKSLFESQYDWEENAPFSIESATIHSLECLVSNQTEDGALCVEVSGCSLSLSGAHIVLIFGCCIFSLLTILHVFLSTEGFKRRRDRSVTPAADKPRSSTANFFLQVYRFLLQRDVRIAHAPPHAHAQARIWRPGTRKTGPVSPSSRAASKTPRPGKTTAHRSRVYSSSKPAPEEDNLSSEEMSGAHSPPILNEQAPMYLPPLTRALLDMYCSNARLDRRLLKSYLQITQSPALDEAVGATSARGEESSIMERMRVGVPSIDQVRAMRDMLKSKLDQVERELAGLGDHRDMFRESNAVIRDGMTRGATKIHNLAAKIGDLPGLPNVRRRLNRSPTHEDIRCETSRSLSASAVDEGSCLTLPTNVSSSALAPATESVAAMSNISGEGTVSRHTL